MRQESSSHLNYIILPIDGMTCAACSARVKMGLSSLDWVDSVDVNLAAEQAAIGFMGSITRADELHQKITETGYRVRTRISELAIPGFNDPTKIQSLQNKLSSIPGLENARFNTANETVSLEYIQGIISVPTVEKLMQEETGITIVWRESSLEADEALEREKEDKIKVQFRNALISISSALIVFVLTMPHFFRFVLVVPQEIRHTIAFLLTGWVLFFAGKEIFSRFFKKLMPGKSDMNTLVGLGASVAFIYSTFISIGTWLMPVSFSQYPVFFDSATFIVGFILLGRSLESRARRQTGQSLNSLTKLQPEKALKVSKGKTKTVMVSSLLQNDECLVKNGERIPADGILLSESAEIDEAMLSGESLPLEKHKGQLLLTGTINTGAELRLKVVKTGAETALGQIVQWVRKAQNSQPPVQQFVDKIAAVFVPSVIIIAFLTLAVWLLSGAEISISLMHFINVIVIACPCALGLATPTAIIVSMGKAASQGILIKDASVMEKLLSLNTVLFDKTGTLTYGNLSFQSISIFKGEENNILQMVASLERNSTHPIAKALSRKSAEKGLKIPAAESVEMLTGFGIRGTIDGKITGVGNRKLMQAMAVNISSETEEQISKMVSDESILIYVGRESELLAIISLADSIRSESKDVIGILKKKNIESAMVTGDGQKTADLIAAKLGVEKVFAEQPPQVKGSIVKQIQKEGKVVAMIGDGINDAVALTRADIGIALAGGTDVAVDAADVVFLKPDLTLLLKTINLAQRTERIIKQNLIWAFGYNLLMLPSAAGALYLFFGIAFNPAFAALAMAMSSVSVVLNSLRLKR